MVGLNTLQPNPDILNSLSEPTIIWEENFEHKINRINDVSINYRNAVINQNIISTSRRNIAAVIRPDTVRNVFAIGA